MRSEDALAPSAVRFEPAVLLSRDARPVPGGGLHRPVPVDREVLHRRLRPARIGQREHHPQQRGAQPATHRAGRLGAVRPHGDVEDLLHPLPAQLLVTPEGLLVVGQVAQALREHHRVLDGQRRPLPGGWRRDVGGVAGEHQPAPVPRRQRGEVVHGQRIDQVLGLADDARRGDPVLGEGLDQDLSQRLAAQFVQLRAARLGARCNRRRPACRTRSGIRPAGNPAAWCGHSRRSRPARGSAARVRPGR